MNVTVVTPAAGGGMLHYASQMANALSKKVDVSVIVNVGADESLFDEGVAVETMDFPNSKSELGPDIVRLWTRLYRRLADDSVDVVHSTDLNALLVPPLLTLQDQQTVFTLHDVYDHPGEWKLRNQVTRFLLMKRMDRIVVHGDYNARMCARRYDRQDKVVQINHGEYSFFRDFCGVPIRHEPELLFFGRIRQYKGLDTLFEANEYIARAVDDYLLTIAGNGPLDESAVSSDHLNIVNKFVPNEQVCELFSRCRAVVLPYREASQSGIVPIAYSFKKPVIATAVGGLPEIIDSGRTGFLVEPGSPKELATKCISLLNDESRAREMGENGFEFARAHMNWDDIAENLISEAYSK